MRKALRLGWKNWGSRMEFHHISVLYDECLESLKIKPSGTYVDATTGGGGHSFGIVTKLDTGKLICFDKDEEALAAAGERLKDHRDRILMIHSDFRFLSEQLQEHGIEKVDGILFDLGVSSYQIDEEKRGFSYQKDAPLDMRMDRSSSLTAEGVVNTYTEADLKRIFSLYGEERYAGRIAKEIVSTREQEPIKTTFELVDLIRKSLPAKALREKQHPARRVFQALRIEVNGELSGLTEALDQAIEVLRPGGRIAVISFHSLEDRIVKEKMRSWESRCTCPPDFPVCICGNKKLAQVITRKPIVPKETEINNNSRAHSAKLRVAERV